MTAEKFSNEDTRFQACLAFTLKYEGGKSDDPHDPGGRTMEGITQATYDAYHDRRGIRPLDVYAMLSGERNEIYRTEYWDAVKAGAMLPGEDLSVFDLAVNSGPARALAIRAAVFRQRDVSTGALISGICARRLSFLHALRTWSYFGSGWGRRVAACEATALKMAGVPLSAALQRATAAKNKHGTAGPVVTGVAVSGMAILHWLAHAALWMVAAFGIFGILLAAIMAFSYWRHGQRVDALTAAISDMQTRAAALKVSIETEATQKAAVAVNIEKQQQQLKTAEAAEAALLTPVTPKGK